MQTLDFCCDRMELNVREFLSVQYDSRFDEYAIVLPEDGSLMCFDFCPWCGKKLPESRREEWLEQNMPDDE